MTGITASCRQSGDGEQKRAGRRATPPALVPNGELRTPIVRKAGALTIPTEKIMSIDDQPLPNNTYVLRGVFYACKNCWLSVILILGIPHDGCGSVVW